MLSIYFGFKNLDGKKVSFENCEIDLGKIVDVGLTNWNIKIIPARSPKISFCFITKKVNNKNNTLPTTVFILFAKDG